MVSCWTLIALSEFTDGDCAETRQDEHYLKQACLFTPLCIAEFIINVHEESPDYATFKKNMQEIGEFEDSFVGIIDRLIRTMHPKYKKAAEPVQADKAAVKDEKLHLFPGLALPNNPGWVSHCNYVMSTQHLTIFLPRAVFLNRVCSIF